MRQASAGGVTVPGSVLVLALLVPLVFLPAACGIPRVGFVAPPREDVELQDPNSSPRIVFEHNAELNNTEDFLGYELYYKLYDNAADPEAYEDDRDVILQEPQILGDGRLRTQKYLPVIPADLSSADGHVPPLITVPDAAKNLGFQVTLSFIPPPPGPTNPGDEAGAEWLGGDTGLPAETVRLARSVPEQGEAGRAPKGFLLGDYAGDIDNDLSQIQRDVDELIGNGDLYMALYAMGYGIDGLEFQRLDSRPLFLGYFRLQPAS